MPTEFTEVEKKMTFFYYYLTQNSLEKKLYQGPAVRNISPIIIIIII